MPDYLLVPGETTIHLVGENTIGTKDAPTEGIQGVPRGHHHHWPRLLLHSQQRRRHHHGTARQRTDPHVTSDIRLQGGTINTNGSSISTVRRHLHHRQRPGDGWPLSTGGDPNTEEAQRARDLVISGRASVTAERLSALQQIQITGSATVTVENPPALP